MKKMILLKIGGGVITDKTVAYGLREEVLSRLAKEIGEAWSGLGEIKLIIGNGAGSFAHYSATKYKTAQGFVDENSRVGMGFVRMDAVKLNQIVVEQCLNEGVPVFPFSASSMMRVNSGKAEEIFTASMEDILEKGMIPIVYGDVMVDRKRGSAVFSTELIFNELVKKFVQDYEIKVIHVSAEEGVYKKGKASIYEMITKDNFEDVKGHLGGSNGVDVSGGMLHKVEECLEIAKLGVCSQIISGMVPGRVRDAILGVKVKGTTIC